MMMKKRYIVPAVSLKDLHMEGMIAVTIGVDSTPKGGLVGAGKKQTGFDVDEDGNTGSGGISWDF